MDLWTTVDGIIKNTVLESSNGFLSTSPFPTFARMRTLSTAFERRRQRWTMCAGRRSQSTAVDGVSLNAAEI